MANASASLDSVFKKWIKNPDTDLNEILESNDLTWAQYSSEKTSKLVCDGIKLISELPADRFNQLADSNLNVFIRFCYRTNSQDAEDFMRLNAFVPLVHIFDRLLLTPIETDSFDTTEMEILKLISAYGKRPQFERLAKIIQTNFMVDSYVWSKIFKNIGESDPKTEIILDGLDGFIPNGFAGIAYLDMANSRSLEDEDFDHPFNNQHGFEWMANVVAQNQAELKNESHIISLVTSFPFLDPEFRTQLISQISTLNSRKISVELAWAGAKLGEETQIQQLVELAKDYRTSKIAEYYLNDLDLSDRIPAGIEDPDFHALREMCSWLSHPNENSTSPDSAEIIAKKELFWPAVEEVRTMYIIQYVYKKHQGSPDDYVNVGVFGSRTFSLVPFDLGDYSLKVHTLKPEEIFGIYASWEAGNLQALKGDGTQKIDPAKASAYIMQANPKVKW